MGTLQAICQAYVAGVGQVGTFAIEGMGDDGGWFRGIIYCDAHGECRT